MNSVTAYNDTLRNDIAEAHLVANAFNYFSKTLETLLEIPSKLHEPLATTLGLSNLN